MALFSNISDATKTDAKDMIAKYGLKKAAALGAGLANNSIAAQIETLPEYQITQEAQDRLALLQDQATSLEQSAAEQTSIARSRAGTREGSGIGAARSDVESSTAQQVSALQQMGGSGFLSALSQVGANREQAYQGVIQNNLAYQEQADQSLLNALQTEAGMRTQAAGLKSQALQGMITEKDKVYQSQLQNAQTSLQYDISKQAMEEEARVAKENKKFLGMF